MNVGIKPLQISGEYIQVYRLTTPPNDTNVEFTIGTINFGFYKEFEFSRAEPVKFTQPGMAAFMLQTKRYSFGPGHFLVIGVCMPSGTGPSVHPEASAVLSMIHTFLELVQPAAQDELLFDGFLPEPGYAEFSPPGPATYRASGANVESVSKSIREVMDVLAKVDAATRTRLQIASAWFMRGGQTVNAVDRVLYYCVAIEVLFGGGKNIVGRVHRTLAAHYPQMDAAQFAAKIQFGPVYNLRSKVVHDGLTSLSGPDWIAAWELLRKAELIARASLYHFSGLPLGSVLDGCLVEAGRTDATSPESCVEGGPGKH